MLVFKKKITAKSEEQPIILGLSDIVQYAWIFAQIFVTSIAKILKETPIRNIDSAV